MHIALTLPTRARVCCALSSTSSSSTTNSRRSPPGEGVHWRRGVGRAVPARSPYCGDGVVSVTEIGEPDGDGADERLSTGRRLRFSLSAIHVTPHDPCGPERGAMPRIASTSRRQRVFSSVGCSRHFLLPTRDGAVGVPVQNERVRQAVIERIDAVGIRPDLEGHTGKEDRQCQYGRAGEREAAALYAPVPFALAYHQGALQLLGEEREHFLDHAQGDVLVLDNEPRLQGPNLKQRQLGGVRQELDLVQPRLGRRFNPAHHSVHLRRLTIQNPRQTLQSLHLTLQPLPQGTVGLDPLRPGCLDQALNDAAQPFNGGVHGSQSATCAVANSRSKVSSQVFVI